MNHWLLTIFLASSLAQCSESQQPKPVEALPVAAASVPIDTTWTEKIVKSKEEWRQILTPEQFEITREQGTERAFSSPLYNNHDEGHFLCVCCENPLFSSETKFNSGTGWPSFYAPYFSRSVSVAADNSHGMTRDEISCARCGAHLGHVFDDGPEPTGLRYCMDGVALKFIPAAAAAQAGKTAHFAAGCFWCMEAIFENVKGVQSVVSGYSGGTEKNPTYEAVGAGETGHAEAIEVVYDPAVVSFQQLVRVFFAAQDPTQVNGQGPDHGKQYRSIAFYDNETEHQIITDYIAQIQGQFSKPIAAQVVPSSTFWKAEDYHQDYVKRHPENPYVQHESIPRLRRTQALIKDLIKP